MIKMFLSEFVIVQYNTKQFITVYILYVIITLLSYVL